MYHSFLIHSFTDGHSGCFQHLAIVNCAAMSTGSFGLVFHDSSNIIPAVELLGQKAVPFLVFWGNPILFSTVAAAVCNYIILKKQTNNPPMLDLVVFIVYILSKSFGFFFYIIVSFLLLSLGIVCSSFSSFFRIFISLNSEGNKKHWHPVLKI